MPIGKIALRILGFLRRGGHSVKTNIRKKYVRGASPDSAEAHRRETATNRVPSWSEFT